MFWYQDHGESCSYEGLHHQEENHRLLPENKNTYSFFHAESNIQMTLKPYNKKKTTRLVSPQHIYFIS